MFGDEEPLFLVPSSGETFHKSFELPAPAFLHPSQVSGRLNIQQIGNGGAECLGLFLWLWDRVPLQLCFRRV